MGALLQLKRKVKYAGLDLVPGLQHELMLHFQQGNTFKHMSEKCNGKPGVATISRLAYGETKFPRFETVMVLYRMLGFTITAER
jgi:hypothetical protein